MDADAAARRRALRQKRILENSGKRLNRILGVPEGKGDEDETERRAPAFEGAPKHAYLGQDSAQTQDLLDKLMGGLSDQSQIESPDEEEVGNTFNLFKITWIMLGLMTLMVLNGPYSWMIGDNSVSVFSAVFCTQIVVAKFMGRPESVPKPMLNVDTILKFVLQLCGVRQQFISQIIILKTYLFTFLEAWSLFYLPFMLKKLYSYLMDDSNDN